MKYKHSERLRLKLAAGMYSQNIISANSDRDVVNLFYGFLSGPENLQSEFTNPSGTVRDVVHSLQTANHVVVGFEYDLTEFLNLNVEGYLKQFTQLTNTNRQKLFPDDIDHNDVPEVLRLDYIIESGFAQGVDMVLKYEKRHSYLWFVYGLGNVDRWDGARWYDPVFDRRHNLNLVASQDFGEKKEWQVSARWALGSGFPFTQSQGYYQSPNVSDGIYSDYITQNAGEITIYYAGLNEGRLPSYHRLDISVRRTFKDVGGGDLDFTAGVTNVYSRKNVFYINRLTGQRKNQLPFLPSVSLDWKF
jgi:hypothetical protein